MTEQPLPNHEDLEKYIKHLPAEIIGRLPENTEKREALRNLDIVYDLAQRARERKADR